MNLEWESFDPLADEDTAELIASGRTIGVFYVESPSTRQLLKRMGRGDYENLVVASSIIRPAANSYIHTWVKRLHGAPYRPLHPLIEQTLAETFGVMVYQEDVSRVAIDLAGFAIEEADRLRKILSKKDRGMRLPDLRERFFRGARARGVPEPTVVKVWDMILSFDGYSFCKAHSASYAQVSFRAAWMKRFYPLELMTAVINNAGGFYGRQTYLDECRRLGIRVLPPDVNASRWEYTTELTLTPGAPGLGDDGRRGLPPRGGLRVGLGQLKAARQELAKTIVDERERAGSFTGFQDFCARVPCRLEDMRMLIRSGALDSVSDGCTRPQLFFRWLGMRREGGTAALTGGLGFSAPAAPVVGDYPERVKLADEVRTLGLVVSRHPLELFRPRIHRVARAHGLEPLVSSVDLPRHVNQVVWAAGILVTAKEVSTRKREPMIFVSFEDELAVFETVLFPDAFARFYPLLDDGWAFLVQGRVEDDLGAFAVTVERLVMISRRGGETAAVTLAGTAAAPHAPPVAVPVAVPDRPPMFLWGRYHDYGDDPLAAARSATAGRTSPGSSPAQHVSR